MKAHSIRLVDDLLRPTYKVLYFFLVAQFAAILLPSVILIWCYGVLIKCAYDFFTPDFEIALVNGYKRPIIGLQLCMRCRTLRFRSTKYRTPHLDTLEHLEASGINGCWLCRSVHTGYLQSIADRDDPPEPDWRDMLPQQHLLMWFAERVETRSGYLDHLRGMSYLKYIYTSHPRELFQDLSSEATFSLIKEWIGRCDKHDQCYQGHQAPLPTRVIDVSQEEPYLLISQGHNAPYITLSHCWGGEQPLTTTTDTLNERTTGTPMTSLPPLYRDAVTVTRKLGIKYLWIDSLCILQDCKEDWSREATRMGDIYRLSYLTLYALSSPNCQQRMLVQRRPVNACMLERLDNCISERRTKEEIFRTGPLCERAWALQERLLSPRLLYYSEEEMFWECLECTAREGSHRYNPYKSTPYRYGSYHCPQVKMPLVRPLDEKPDFPVSLPSDWQIIVSEYSSCRLTFPSDRLPALSGLAYMFQRNTGYTYMAGLWQEDLANGLLWFCPNGQDKQPAKAPADGSYRGPSWSWISTELAVRFKALEHVSRASRFGEIEFVASDVQLSGSDPMGDIVSACLSVRASFYQISYAGFPHSRNCAIFGSDEEKFGTGILDAVEEQAGTRKRCAAVLITQKSQEIFRHRTNTTYFIIVIPIPGDGEEECWRRIGLAWTTREVLLAPQMSIIRLV